MFSSAIVPRLLSLHVGDCLIRLTINHSIAGMAVAISATARRKMIQRNFLPNNLL